MVVGLVDTAAEDVDGPPADGEVLVCVPGIIDGGATLLVTLHLTEDDGHALGAAISLLCVVVGRADIADETRPVLEQGRVGLRVELP